MRIRVDSLHIILGNTAKFMCQIYLGCISYAYTSSLFWKWLILIGSKLLQQKRIDARFQSQSYVFFRSVSWNATLFSHFPSQSFKCNVRATSVNWLVWGTRDY